ncbi:hypothetical protein BsWGS_28834 [Bradybaena similaris]
MAGKSEIARLLERVRSKFVQELDINKVFPRLLRRGIFTISEEKRILEPTVPQKRIDLLLDIISKKDSNVFLEFCKTLEECDPHLLTVVVLDTLQDEKENPPTQALQLGFELALKERDAVLRENAKAQEERDVVIRQLKQVMKERDLALLSLENLTGKQANLKDKQFESNSPTLTGSKKMKDKLLVTEADQGYAETNPNMVWETHNVRLQKAPTFGFGIAVSGGRDSPHFANGDPSVAISDVLKAGPAEGKLQINDRLVSVNGIPLDNVDHNTAISVLRDCGNIVNLVVRRRIVLPSSLERSCHPFSINLNKTSKKDEFGIVLGCKLFIKEIVQQSLASRESSLKEGHIVLKINNTPVENLSLMEAKKLIDKCRDKLQLIVKKERCYPSSSVAALSSVADDVLSDKGDVSVFQAGTHSEEELHVKDPSSGVQNIVPPGAYPHSENTRYDGHYVLDNDLPAKATLPQCFETNVQHQQDDMKSLPHVSLDGYHNGQDGTWQGQVEPPPWQRSGDYFDEAFTSRIVHDLDPRSVTFPKDKQTGLGLRLAGGNATGIFIASVQPGSAGEREGLVEGDQIILANEKEITEMTREEAVSFLTSLEGQVTLIVQYRKEEYDRIMASHEAGDSFYIRTHFQHSATDTSEHSFKIGDVFHVKDTLFRGIGGAWLALSVSEDKAEQKKGTIPNSKIAEILKNQQKEDRDKENFPNRGKGSLFKRKTSSRRVKSLGKDHWDEVIFAGYSTKFSAYERVVNRDPGFVRPVVIFGAIADIARERLLAEYPDKFYFPQMDKSTDLGEKRDKVTIIRLSSIQEAITHWKHCLLDVTPYSVDRLNYAQYNPIVIFLRAENKQAVKDVRGRWKTTAKSVRKLLEQSDKIEKQYSHLFTGQLKHMGTDAWFPKLYEMIDSQQRQKIWMSEKRPAEDMSDDFMFPMSTRLSYAAGVDSDLDIPQRQSDLHVSPVRKQRLVRASSDPSVNTHEKIPGIPPYPSPPTYKNQKIPSNDSRHSGSDMSPKSPLRDDYLMHPEDHYYPSYYADQITSSYQASRAHIDPYATLTPSERLRPHAQPGSFPSGYNEFSSYSQRTEAGSRPSGDVNHKTHTALNTQGQGSYGLEVEHRGYADSSSHSSDSYSKYISSPQNKHDDTKLREKFGSLQPAIREKSPGHDPYRFTRSTAHPVTSNVDRAKISDLSAKYRKQDSQPKPGVGRQAVPLPNQQSVIKKEEPPPVPVKTYTLKQREIEPDDLKVRNYENSSRAFNHADVSTASGRQGASAANVIPPLLPPPTASSYPSGLDTDRPYEYVSLRQTQSSTNFGEGGGSNRADYPRQPSFHHHNILQNSGCNNAPSSSKPYQQTLDHQNKAQQFQQEGRGRSLDSTFPHPSHYPHYNNEQDYQHSKAYSNEVYMDHYDLQKFRQSKKMQIGTSLSGYTPSSDQAVRERGREDMQRGFPALERGYARPRTDEEQQLEIQRARCRAKSETRLAEMSSVQQHWNNTSSSITLLNGYTDSTSNLQRATKVTSSTVMLAGAQSLRNRSRANAGRYKSWDASRTDANFPPSYSQMPANSAASSGSAFTSYKKPVKQASFSGTTNSANTFHSSASLNKGRFIVKQKPSSDSSQSGGSNLRSQVNEESESMNDKHTIVATAKGVFTSKGGLLESPETGVSILVPEGAIEDNKDQEIYFKVCRDNSLLPPLDTEKGETLLSPLVMCGPHGTQFLKPVELRLPHSASANPESWSFALKSSESPSGQTTEWQNMTLAGSEGLVTMSVYWREARALHSPADKLQWVSHQAYFWISYFFREPWLAWSGG